MIQSTQFALREGEIHLGIGHPEESLLAKDVLRQAAAHRFAQEDAAFLQYGADFGDDFFRLELAKFLSNHYGFAVDASSLYITNGISQALDFVCRYLSQRGDTIFVEEPSYFLALHIFADYDLTIIPVTIDADGLITDNLETLIKKHKPKLLYTIPIHQNPSGVSLSEKRREKLVELAQTYDFLILADEVYHLLNYEGHAPKAMAAYIDSKQVISLGSFSKILAPGLRLGWLGADPSLLAKLALSGMVQSGGGLNPFSSGLVRSALELGLQDNHLSYVKDVYSQRLEAMYDALKPLNLKFHKPKGGYFFWLELPEGMDANLLLDAAIKQGVSFQPGPKFSSQEKLSHFIRLCFSYYDTDLLKEGVKRLHTAMNTM